MEEQSKKELSFVLTISSKIISVNNLYKAGLKYIKGKPVPYIYKNPKAAEIEREIIEQLRAIDFSEYKDWLSKTKQFDITISFIFKSNVTRRDCENQSKNIIDDVVRFVNNELGITSFDDRLFNSVHLYKSMIPKSKHEYACIKLTESKVNLRFDKIDEPEKFYIGPELDEYKKEIKKILKEKKLKMTDKLEEKDRCNSFLYILTPGKSKTLINETNKIVNEAWNCVVSDFGFLFVGVKIEEDITPDLKLQLDDFISLIKKISNGGSRIKIGYIKEIKEIFEL